MVHSTRVHLDCIICNYSISVMWGFLRGFLDKCDARRFVITAMETSNHVTISRIIKLRHFNGFILQRIALRCGRVLVQFYD